MICISSLNCVDRRDLKIAKENLSQSKLNKSFLSEFAIGKELTGYAVLWSRIFSVNKQFVQTDRDSPDYLQYLALTSAAGLIQIEIVITIRTDE